MSSCRRKKWRGMRAKEAEGVWSGLTVMCLQTWVNLSIVLKFRGMYFRRKFFMWRSWISKVENGLCFMSHLFRIILFSFEKLKTFCFVFLFLVSFYEYIHKKIIFKAKFLVDLLMACFCAQITYFQEAFSLLFYQLCLHLKSYRSHFIEAFFPIIYG